MTKLTQRQLAIITEEELGKNRNVSLSLSLHADLVLFMRDHPDRFNDNFSAVIREACLCYLHFGEDWRDTKADSELRQVIREEFKRLKVVVDSGDVVATGEEAKRMLDDSDGFFS